MPNSDFPPEFNFVWPQIFIVFCDKSPQSINYMRWATVGHCHLKHWNRDRVSSLVKRVLKKESAVWGSSSLCWKGYFGRRRNKNTGLIENTDESCCPLFQTDEKTRERRENPHEFMHQSCHTSGHGTLIGGRFVPRGTPRTLSMKERWWLAAAIKCSCHSGASRETPIMIHDEIRLFHSPQKFPSTDLEANHRVRFYNNVGQRSRMQRSSAEKKNIHFDICCAVQISIKKKKKTHTNWPV